jgi:hypothetical protein
MNNLGLGYLGMRFKEVRITSIGLLNYMIKIKRPSKLMRLSL